MHSEQPSSTGKESSLDRVKRFLIGAPRDFRDPTTHHKIALAAFLAWVGLGADGLSSSAYGPEEAFLALEEHKYLGVFLAIATGFTVFIISYAYSKIIEHFPMGGGGYLVATKMLGDTAGVVSGSALLVDYVLTIATSIAGGGDAVFSLLPQSWSYLKVPVELAAILVLIIMNLRGVKESVTVLIPIFLTFVLMHAVLIGGVVMSHLFDLPAVVSSVYRDTSNGIATIGFWGLLLVFLRAYSLGGGTYTGIEAVSNGMAILREPKVATGKRTMLYMASSLAVTAAGLLLCYMLIGISKTPGRTLNASLAESLFGGLNPGGVPIGTLLVLITIGSEAVLLLVAAQTGFIDGPRIMANMALDSWLPRRFAALSDRLTNQNGILLMGAAAMTTLWFTQGSIVILLVMYSINVFLTFSLSQLGMLKHWMSEWLERKRWNRDLLIHLLGFAVCFSILGVMIFEKFTEGGWITVLITLGLVGLCGLIRWHYRNATIMVRAVDRKLANVPKFLKPDKPEPVWDAARPTAILLVGGYGGLGLHILFTVMRIFPETFHNFIFVSIGALDSNFFRGGSHVDELEKHTQDALQQYVDVARKAGRPARFACRLSTDVVESASDLCVELHQQHPRAVVFAGTLAFDRPHWWDKFLHNETAYAIQRRLKFAGVPMVILPLLVESDAR
ncbi:MAG: hypothetical protein CHACPFDD_01834 [Phycisphaerae bacterium]|nr:hypothetical protein [Phycisphaerae bacterium]